MFLIYICYICEVKQLNRQFVNENSVLHITTKMNFRLEWKIFKSTLPLFKDTILLYENSPRTVARVSSYIWTNQKSRLLSKQCASYLKSTHFPTFSRKHLILCERIFRVWCTYFHRMKKMETSCN